MSDNRKRDYKAFFRANDALEPVEIGRDYTSILDALDACDAHSGARISPGSASFINGASTTVYTAQHPTGVYIIHETVVKDAR